MENLKRKEQKRERLNVDFTKQELEYILENANFNEIQERIFKRLTSKAGRQSIVQISMEENISTATVSRIVKQIKSKIKKII